MRQPCTHVRVAFAQITQLPERSRALYSEPIRQIERIDWGDFATVCARHGAGKVAQEVPIPGTIGVRAIWRIFGDLGRSDRSSFTPMWGGRDGLPGLA